MSAESQPEGCFLCRKPAEQRDDENLILHRGATVFAIMNLYPYNSGHVMVAPYSHTGDFGQLKPEVAADLVWLAQRCVRVLSDAYHPDGFNLGMNLGAVAGAGEPGHLHCHVVPRWGGDTNFMPVAADTKVLPESLQQTYAKLKPRFETSA